MGLRITRITCNMIPHIQPALAALVQIFLIYNDFLVGIGSSRNIRIAYAEPTYKEEPRYTFLTQNPCIVFISHVISILYTHLP